MKWLLICTLLLSACATIAVSDKDPNMPVRSEGNQTEGRIIECYTCESTNAAATSRHADSGATEQGEVR